MKSRYFGRKTAELSEASVSNLNPPISIKEVSVVVSKAKLKKAFLEIPNEILKNNNAKELLHSFFLKFCFENSVSPSAWDYSDIKPIPKKDKDQRDPLQNRCITLMCCVSKIYSSIINARLQRFLEVNELLVDEQNGFRASRSCIDHIFVLCTILRNRQAQKLSAFLTFVDFKKAFDSVDRNLLLFKLSQMGINGKL